MSPRRLADRLRGARVVLFVSLRLLLARKFLNGLAVVGVTIGVLTLIAVQGIMDGFSQKFLLNILKANPHLTIEDFELRPPADLIGPYAGGPAVARVTNVVPGDRALRIRRPEETVRALAEMGPVSAATLGVSGPTILSFGQQQRSVELKGVDPLAQDLVTPMSGYVVEGSWRAFAASPDTVVLGAGAAKRLGARLGNQLLATSVRGDRIPLKLVALYETDVTPIDNRRAYAHLTTAQLILGRPDRVDRIEARMHDPEEAEALSKAAERIFGYDAESWQEANAGMLGVFKQQAFILKFVDGAILALGGFGILAIQIMIVLQKTRDIAILRSMGFYRRDILAIFLLQGVLIAAAGCAIGEVGANRLIAYLGTLKIARETLVKSDTFLVTDDPVMYVYAAAFALFVGVTASLIPAIRGSRVEPVEVLRGRIE